MSSKRTDHAVSSCFEFGSTFQSGLGLSVLCAFGEFCFTGPSALTAKRIGLSYAV